MSTALTTQTLGAGWESITNTGIGAPCSPVSSETRPDTSHWYAVQTRVHQERIVKERLAGQGVTTFLPLITELHRWSDRRKKIELPLFSSYVFVRFAPTPQELLRVRCVGGVVRIIGSGGAGTPIPDEEIDSIRMLLSQRPPWYSHPFLKSGQRVRIRGGALDGLEGIFLSRGGDDTLVVSVAAIQRSLAVRISGYDIVPV
jgi:transcriptional antiterminator RfaH